MAEKPSVLIIHNYYQLSGGEDTVVANEKRLLEEHGHKVVMYTRSNNEIKTLGVLQKLLLPFLAIFNIRTYREVRKVIQREEIDVVHVHNTLTMISPAVYYAAMSRRVPVVQTVHNFRLVCPGALLYRDGHICEDCIGSGLHCSLKHNCYRGSKLQTWISVLTLRVHRMLGTYKKLHYICLTHFNRDKLLEGKGRKIFDPEKMYIKPNFTEKAGKMIPYKNRKKQFVFVGRPEKVKGIEVLLEAWRDIKDYQLIVCGSSKEMETVEQYIYDNRMENVILSGNVENARVKELLSESIAMILPTQLYEGFPMTIIESYSCGTPVLGSDMGNAGFLIRDGETGYRFQHDSSRDLREKVSEMAARDLTENCRKYYEENFDAEKNYDRLLEIYSKVLAYQRS